jgi:small basic protein
VRALRIPAAVVAVLALVVATALALGWSFSRAAYLAPVIVVGAAAVAGLLILWGKVAVQQLRETRRPRLVVALWVLGIALIVLLTFLGVKLPREG